jgi:hypothetical protein
MDNPKANEEVRKFLAAIGAKGGKVLTEKKKAHLNKVASKGGKTVTPKRLAQIRKMVADRVAKQRAAREGK